MSVSTLIPTNPTPEYFLETALHLAGDGFRVFPVIPGGKLPAIKNNLELASTDPDEIRKMWSRPNAFADGFHIRPFNIGIATGRFKDGYLLVLDVDVKNGARGLESLEMLDMMAPEPWRDGTHRVDTPSGGFHLYFFGREPLATTASKLGPGLDTRGVGGYVVAPGSMVGDKFYSVHAQ